MVIQMIKNTLRSILLRLQMQCKQTEQLTQKKLTNPQEYSQRPKFENNQLSTEYLKDRIHTQNNRVRHS